MPSARKQGGEEDLGTTELILRGVAGASEQVKIRAAETETLFSHGQVIIGYVKTPEKEFIFLISGTLPAIKDRHRFTKIFKTHLKGQRN